MPTLAAAAAANSLDRAVFTLGAREGTLRWRVLPGISLVLRLTEILTGLRFARPLANPRLEALRSAAAKLRQGSHLSAVEHSALAHAGFTIASAHDMLTRFDGRRHA